MLDHIKVEYTDDEVRIDLPVRQSDELRRFGWNVVVAGLCVIAFCLIFVPADKSFIGIGPALGAISLGICFVIHKTSCRIRLSKYSLETVEYFGWLRWTHSCHTWMVNKFVHSSILNMFTEVFAQFMPRGLENLTLELEHFEALYTLVYWYPRSVLEEITCELVPEIKLLRADSQSVEVSGDEIEADEPATTMPVTNQQTHEIEVLEQAEHAAIVRKPVGSRVKLEKHDQAIVFKVPPKGFWKGAGDLPKVCAVVLFLIGFATLGNCVSIIQGNTAWWKVIYPIPWWALGFGFWAFCYRLGRAAVTIGASAESLWIDQTVGLTENRITEFDRNELKRITPKLQVVDSSGNVHPIVTTLNEREIEWIVYELHQYLKTESE